jgi:DNA-binding SARP family transcriptional activator
MLHLDMKIKLLGLPEIRDGGGHARAVRGQQAWALLSRVVLARRPLARGVLASELFPDTTDPLASLRWTLATLRKSLSCPDALRGDPVELALPEGVGIDVLELDDPDFDFESAGPLLEGMEPRCGPEFSTWLLVERERIASLTQAHLRRRAQEALAQGRSQHAVLLAELCVRRSPLDEGLHILLVKSLIAAGRFDGACEHVDATDRLFREQLGQPPTDALRSAARRTLSSPPSGMLPAAVVEALLRTGLAALAAGTVEAGVDCLRRAATDAQDCRDARLQGVTLLELGTALVHSVRGHDDEGAILLRQSVEWARRCGDAGMAVTAYRELAYVDALAGRRPTASAHLAHALELADSADALAGLHAVAGFNLVDWGKVDEGLAQYELSLEEARRAGNRRREAWSLGLGGRGLLAASRPQDADAWLKDCLKLVDDLRWTSFRPWPSALLGESRIRLRDDRALVQEELQNAFALSCQLADPCWEAAVARAIGLAHEARGSFEEALRWIGEARQRCVRETDTYVALLVEILIDDARLSSLLGLDARANTCKREAVSLAARSHMDAHVERAACLA